MQFDHFLTLCLDIQRQNILGFAILNYRNEFMLHEQYDISHLNGMREIAAYAYELFQEKRRLPQFQASKFLGIGVIVSGIFEKRTEIILNSAILAMEGAPVKAIVEDVFQIPCYVDNESNLCAISVQQQRPDMSDFLYMHISQGVGIGIIANGMLLRACLKSSNEDGNEGKNENLSRNKEFTLTIFPKSAEFVKPAEKTLYHPAARQHNKLV